ncbi:uncharacterized protein METZ01_LOCUS397714, partial [marine metagenome]
THGQWLTLKKRLSGATLSLRWKNG